MAYTLNRFTFTGTTDFDLAFSGGYLTRSDVTCVKSGPEEQNVNFDWLTDTRVRVSTSGLDIGDTLVFKRTVSKVHPPVDMMQPGNFTREAVVTAVTHILYALQEVLDGRFDEFNTIFIDVLRELIAEAEVSAGRAESMAGEAQNYAEEAAFYAGQVFEPETIFAQQYTDAKLMRA